MKPGRDKSRDITLKLGDVLTFGRYRGALIQHVIDKNPLYVGKLVARCQWVHLNKEMRERLYEALRRLKDEPPQAT